MKRNRQRANAQFSDIQNGNNERTQVRDAAISAREALFWRR